MRFRSVCAASVVGMLALWLAPSAAANQLLETVSVDAGSTEVTTGTTQLKAGTKYELHVSGTFTLANGFGESFTEDALYCFDDSGFVSPVCSQTPMRYGDFYIGSGSSSLQNIDAYQAPGGGGTQLGYSVSHTYIVDFYPPADGTLSAGGTLAKTHCKSDPTPCTTTITGTMEIQIYGPAPPPPNPCGRSAHVASASPPTPLVIPTPSAPGKELCFSLGRGDEGLGSILELGRAATADVGIGGLSADDIVVLDGAKHQCYVNFTNELLSVLSRGEKSLQGAIKSAKSEREAKELQKTFDEYVVSLSIIRAKAELEECVALVQAVEVLGASGKFAADTAETARASCQMTRITLSVSGSGAKTRLKSVKVGSPNDKHRRLNVSCARVSGGVAASVSTRSKGTPLSSVVGSSLGFGIVRSSKDRPGGQISVVFNTGGASSGPPNIAGSWVNKAAPTGSPPWQLTTSNGLRTLDATWTGGAGHTGLHGTFHGSLTKANGLDAYKGNFTITEGGGSVSGTMSFAIDNANQIEIYLQPTGGQLQHYTFVRAG